MRPPRTGPVAVVVAPVRAAARLVRAVRDRLVPQNFGEIVPGRIYRSGRLTADAVRDVRRRFGIRTIVDLAAAGADAPERQAEIRAIERAGIRRVGLVLRGDGRGEPGQYAEALRILADPASHPVLVHCAAGAHRTSTAAVLYLHIFGGASREEAERTCLRHGCDLARRRVQRAYIDEHVERIRDMALADAADVAGAATPDPGDAQPGAVAVPAG